MISSGARVLVSLKIDRIITVRLPQTTAIIHEQVKPNIEVVTIGQQGPVGTVSESVLAAAAQAKAISETALKQTQITSGLLDEVIMNMTNGFNFHAGVIST
ncbi:hypothetical protein ACPV38_02945 [Photobacterium damselae]|uniref:hypothetical protein n=1 Tax=Photobacterium damselae TaxID=38293 RepID=UPI00406990BC